MIKGLRFKGQVSNCWLSDAWREWNPYPGKDTGVGSNSLLQGIFLTQGWKPGLLHCRQTLYHLSHQGSPYPNLGRTRRSLEKPYDTVPPQPLTLEHRMVPGMCVVEQERQVHQGSALRGGHVRNCYMGSSQCSSWDKIPLLFDNTDVSKSISTSLTYHSEFPEQDINR